MDENLGWKLVYIAAIFSLLVLGIAYFLISPRESPYFKEEKTEKIAEFQKTRVEGRKEGKIVWELFAASGWTEKNQDVTHLEMVRDGKIYSRQGKLILTDLNAPKARAFRYSEIVEAFGPLSAYLDLSKFSSRPKPKSDWTKMIGDRIKYIPAEKRSELEGNVILTKKDSNIQADKIIIDHEKKIADISGNIRIKRRDGTIRANAIEYLGEAEQLNAAGDLRLDLQEGKIKTFIKCDQGVIYLDENQDITLSGSLEAAQGKKTSSAREGTYSRKQKGLFLRGGTRTVLEPGERKKLKEKTVVSANEIFFSTLTGDARASGSVEAFQKGREARSETAVYDDKNEVLTLTGNVRMKKGDQWIRCQKVIISVKKETFEALGVAEARFKL